MGWQQKFDKVHDAVEVRVGGEHGPLVQWRDRGFGGQFTWCWKDPVGETRDISFWVGDGDKIKLWCRVWKTKPGTGDHQCDMDTMYNGEKKQRWEFDKDEDHEIDR